jgi:asparagine synthase (glutamine-hydrolysing)
MCGLSGFWTRTTATSDRHAAVLRAMTDAVAHRGPDSSGAWIDASHGIGMGHRRLAILDLSPHGYQPMTSQSGRYVIVFNGEIYNFRELRKLLQRDVTFSGTSDTEVMLAGIEQWGIAEAVKRFVGMFAFALWDKRDSVLHLVRDRLGIKPLYYGHSNGTFLFGSELHAMRAFPGFEAEIDRDALALLLRHNCIPAPFSIYRGVRKQRPGTILSFRSPSDPPISEEYWSASEIACSGLSEPFQGSMDAAADELERLLREAIGMRMISDVPLGAFLSGGIDSALVVALMQAQSDRPIKTFTIGSDDAAYDESTHASAVAAHLGTEHTELTVTSSDALAVVPYLAQMYDEPFADSSQIPTFLVSELARRHVTVSLSGDGGDELFGGYNRHLWGDRVWRVLRWIPPSVRHSIGQLLESTTPAKWDHVYEILEPFLPSRLRHQMFGYKVNKLGSLVGARNTLDLYRRVASHWDMPAEVVIGSSPVETLLLSPEEESWEFRSQMMYLDLVSYLPDDILTKVDRASMAVSLEARVPLLDHRVVEFAWRLPRDMKIRNGQSKWLLRQVLYRHVPRSLVDRPKSGFGIPLDAWLRGPLRDWAEDLLDESRLAQEGYFKPREVRNRWHEHLSGRSSWQYHLWDVLMFQSWLEAQSKEVQGRSLLEFCSVRTS